MVDVFLEEPPTPLEENLSRGATLIAEVKVGTTTMPSDLDGSAASQRQAEQEIPSSTDQHDDEGTFNESNIEQEEVTLEVGKIVLDEEKVHRYVRSYMNQSLVAFSKTLSNSKQV